MTLTVLPLPNLKIVSIKASNPNPKANTNVEFEIVITNTGNANASNALFALRRSTDATIAGNDPAMYYVYVSLAAGATTTIKRTQLMYAQYGKVFYVGARIDDNSVIAETNENDNVGVVKITLQ